MSCRKQSQPGRNRRQARHPQNSSLLKSVLDWLIPTGELSTKDRFHGNSKWAPAQVAQQALIWGWQETKYVTDAFDQASEVCEELGLRKVAKGYTSFMNAIDR